MDTNNRVYINPNFNRISCRDTYPADSLNSNNHLYVNPNFTRHLNDGQQITNLNRKIYVNPNFINTTKTLDKNEFSESTLKVNGTNNSKSYADSMANKHSNITQCSVDNTSACSSSKSRYRLVRINDIKGLHKEHRAQESCTIKINKYKSIPLINFKNNLQMVKTDPIQQLGSKCYTNTSLGQYTNRNCFKQFKSIPFHNSKNNLQIVKTEPSRQSSSKSYTNSSMAQYTNRNCFKLIRNNPKPTLNSSLKLTPKSNVIKSKRNLDFKLQLKLKVLNGTRKKNNIPCRLFTKYGKCLRNLYGTCEYLHDKRHVSLCRKFLKGICHEKECLLSHELSSKKMPTCYFYLKGMCTKEDCPYLHVKLGAKSKVCHDFLKGYCDKGDMCLQRHVRPHVDKSNSKQLYTLNKDTSYKNPKLIISKLFKTDQFRRQSEKKNIEKKDENRHIEQVMNDVDCRYFKDLQNKDPMCDIKLKPTRCKLGTLPSFIHL